MATSTECKALLIQTIHPPVYDDDDEDDYYDDACLRDFITYKDKFAFRVAIESCVHWDEIIVFRFSDTSFLVGMNYMGSCAGCSRTLSRQITTSIHGKPRREHTSLMTGVIQDRIQDMEWFDSAVSVWAYVEGQCKRRFRQEYRNIKESVSYRKGIESLTKWLKIPL